MNEEKTETNQAEEIEFNENSKFIKFLHEATPFTPGCWMFILGFVFMIVQAGMADSHNKAGTWYLILSFLQQAILVFLGICVIADLVSYFIGKPAVIIPLIVSFSKSKITMVAREDVKRSIIFGVLGLILWVFKSQLASSGEYYDMIDYFYWGAIILWIIGGMYLLAAHLDFFNYMNSLPAEKYVSPLPPIITLCFGVLAMFFGVKGWPKSYPGQAAQKELYWVCLAEIFVGLVFIFIAYKLLTRRDKKMGLDADSYLRRKAQISINSDGEIEYPISYSVESVREFLVKHHDDTPVLKKFIEGFTFRFNKEQDIKTLEKVIKELATQKQLAEEIYKYSQIQVSQRRLEYEAKRLEKEDEIERARQDVELAKLNKEKKSIDKESDNIVNPPKVKKEQQVTKSPFEREKEEILRKVELDKLRLEAGINVATQKANLLISKKLELKSKFPDEPEKVEIIMEEIMRILFEENR